MYAQGVDVWLAPTLARVMPGSHDEHLARENRMYVVGSTRSSTATGSREFPNRDRLVPPSYLAQNCPWVEQGNTVIVAPGGRLLAGPVREKEETLIAESISACGRRRRLLDPVGHYNRPDIFRLLVDTSARPAVVAETARPQELPTSVA